MLCVIVWERKKERKKRASTTTMATATDAIAAKMVIEFREVSMNYFSEYVYPPDHARPSYSPLVLFCQIYTAHDRRQHFILTPTFIPTQLSFVTNSG